MQTGRFNVVTDSQWGSCGKGAIAAYLAWKHRPQFLSTTNMANAGHTAVNQDGAAFVAKAIPCCAMLNRWVPDYKPTVVIGPSAAFGLEQLLKEVGECGLGHHASGGLWIHPRAGVITQEHREREAGGGDSTKHIASTMQGCGTFLSDKVLRKRELKLARDYPELAPYFDCPPGEEGKNYDPDFDPMPLKLLRWLDMGRTILHEGSQGFSLDINHGSHYPQCYSPDTLVTVRKSTDGVEHNIRIRDLAGEPYDQIKDLTGWTSLDAVWERPDPEPLLAIVAGQHTLPVTAGHPVRVLRDGNPTEIRADQVRPGDWVWTPVPERPTHTKRLNDAMAYAIGYYLGDGWTVGERREAAAPRSREKERARYARYRARKAAGVVGTPVTQTPTRPRRTTQAYGVIYSSEDFHNLPGHLTAMGMQWYTKSTPTKASKLYVWSSHFARALDDLGIKSEMAPNKRLMPDYLSYSDSTLAAILAGHIDSDGGVYNGRRIRFGITSLVLCAQWQRWLHSRGIKCLVRPEKKYRAGYGDNPNTNKWRLEIRFHANQEESDILRILRRLSRKMERYRTCSTDWYMGESRSDRPTSAFHFGTSRVLKVQKINGKRAWDLTTGTGYFMANGVRGHNCTSRQTTATQNLADVGLPFTHMGDVYLVVRPYPIRVGSVKEGDRVVGYSGDAYPGQKELSWEEVADRGGLPESEKRALLSKELTTVTRRLRRVFEFSDRQVREAAAINGATKIALNFANYIDWECRDTDDPHKITPKVFDFIHRVEDAAGAPVVLVGTGPRINHVIDLR